MRVVTIPLLTAGLWLLSGQTSTAQEPQPQPPQSGMCGMPSAQAAPGAAPSGCPCMQMMAMMMRPGGMMNMPGMGQQMAPDQGGGATAPQPQQTPPQ